MTDAMVAKAKTDEKNIVLASDSGIGNRIFFMASVIRIYDMKEFTLWWPNNGWVSAKFFDLFRFDWDYNIIEQNETLIERNLFTPDNKPLCYTEGWRLYISKNDGLKKHFAYLYRDTPNGYSIDLEYNRIPEKIKNIYRPFFNRLKPSKTVTERINSIISVAKENIIAVQIRNNFDWSKHNRNVDINVYFSILDKYPKDTKFYISTMNVEDLNKFIERYGQRVIYLPNKDYNSMTDAAADLFMLSKCNKMVVSYESTFPALAWWIGGANAQVTIAGLPSRTKLIWRKFKNLIKF